MKSWFEIVWHNSRKDVRKNISLRIWRILIVSTIFIPFWSILSWILEGHFKKPAVNQSGSNNVFYHPHTGTCGKIKYCTIFVSFFPSVYISCLITENVWYVILYDFPVGCTLGVVRKFCLGHWLLLSLRYERTARTRTGHRRGIVKEEKTAQQKLMQQT